MLHLILNLSVVIPSAFAAESSLLMKSAESCLSPPPAGMISEGITLAPGCKKQVVLVQKDGDLFALYDNSSGKFRAIQFDYTGAPAAYSLINPDLTANCGSEIRVGDKRGAGLKEKSLASLSSAVDALAERLRGSLAKAVKTGSLTDNQRLNDLRACWSGIAWMVKSSEKENPAAEAELKTIIQKLTPADGHDPRGSTKTAD